MAQVYFSIKCVLIVLFGVLVQENTSYVLIEGDIIGEPSVENVRQTLHIESVRSKRAIMNKKKTWNFGVVPYEIDASFKLQKSRRQ